MVLQLIFPKELVISAIVCDASAIEVLECLEWSLKLPCNPYTEVIRGLVVLQTEGLTEKSGYTLHEQTLRFLNVNYVNRRVKFGVGQDFLDLKCYSFNGALKEIILAQTIMGPA